MLDNYDRGSLCLLCQTFRSWPGWLLACSSKGEVRMTKADLVPQVAAAGQLPKHQTEEVISRFLEAIMAVVQTEQRVDLRGFGSFRLRQRQARTGRNPRTGDTIPILAKQVPTFTPGKAFQELVQPETARAHE